MALDHRHMRCFVAVDLDPAVKRQLSREIGFLQLAGADVRWTPETNMHLTVRFLGDVDSGELLPLINVLRQAASCVPPCMPTISGIETFASGDTPKILAAGVEGDVEPLHVLFDVLQETLKPLGFRPEPRPLKLHVTLGRVRGTRGLDDLKHRLKESSVRRFGDSPTHSFQLMLSERSSGGSLYTVMEDFPFEGSLSDQRDDL